MLPQASPGHEKQGIGVYHSVVHTELQAGEGPVIQRGGPRRPARPHFAGAQPKVVPSGGQLLEDAS